VPAGTPVFVSSGQAGEELYRSAICEAVSAVPKNATSSIVPTQPVALVCPPTMTGSVEVLLIGDVNDRVASSTPLT
jgi:hypothetical protein